MIKAYSFSCQGESHKVTDKVCQDYSMAVADDSLSVAIVCDGHGGEPYFRSDVGAEYAAEAALHSITFFCRKRWR
jgi:serine/threonine protein phosphatase PrpC